jgi:hypothetical protein
VPGVAWRKWFLFQDDTQEYLRDGFRLHAVTPGGMARALSHPFSIC